MERQNRTEIRDTFKNRFHELRAETPSENSEGKYMSQDEFSKFIGITRPTVGFYENGDRIPDAEIISKICKRCNVSADYLLGLSEEKDLDAVVQEVYRSSGLSAAAVSKLKEQRSIWSKDSEDRDGMVDLFLIVNKIIESEYFWAMATQIRALAHDTADKLAFVKSSDHSENEKKLYKNNTIAFEEFQISQSASRIAESIVCNMLDKEDL